MNDKTDFKNTTDSNEFSHSELNEIIDEIEELHPINFRLAFGLTHEQAAEILCLEPQTLRAYVKKKPSKQVKKLAAFIAKDWILNEGRQPSQPDFLINDQQN